MEEVHLEDSYHLMPYSVFIYRWNGASNSINKDVSEAKFSNSFSSGEGEAARFAWKRLCFLSS